MIYYISDGQYVKIGLTRDMKTLSVRLANLQTANARTLAVMLLVPGDVVREGQLHDVHRDLHMRGEWFKAEGPLAWCAFDMPPDHVMTVEDIPEGDLAYDDSEL